MENRSIKLTPELFFDLLLILIWGRNFLVKYAQVFLKHIPYLSYAADMIVVCLYLVCGLLAAPYIAEKVKAVDLIAFFALQMLFVMNLLLFQENWAYLSQKTLFICGTMLPLYFVGLRLDQKKQIDLLYVVSLINIAIELVYRVFLHDAMSATESRYAGNMDLAYKLLPHICLVLMYAMNGKSLLNGIAAAICFVFIISCGTRGALVIMVVFSVLFFLLLKKHKRPLLTYSLLGTAGVLVASKMDRIFAWLYHISVQMGMSIRIFDKIASGKFWESRGRDAIRTKLFQAIEARPLAGYGMGADYLFAGTYAHNIVIEFLVSYGALVGTILLLLILLTIAKGFFAEKDRMIKGFILMMSCTVFLKLMLSGSYLDELYFLFAIGICVGANRRKGTAPCLEKSVCAL